METKIPITFQKITDFVVTLEQFDTETEFRQRLYGRNGIHSSITLYFQGRKTDLPNGYDYLKPYISQDYCIIYIYKK